MKRLYVILMTLMLVFGISVSAQATLWDRSGGMIYDDDLNITWLQDANYANTSGYDTDGRMSWYDATTWASNLSYGGYDDWRLPTTFQPDPSCSGEYFPGGGLNCIGSEMGHLYYAELGNPAGGPLTNTGYFTNVSFVYWSSTEYVSNGAWVFHFYNGFQEPDGKGDDFSGITAWAVRDGDVSSVPEPGTLLLLSSGLAGLIVMRRKFSA